jgi:hypothetical protein
MKITNYPGNVIYIEDAFPESLDFIKNIEEFDKNPLTHSVIPKWLPWYESIPVKKSKNLTENDLDDWDRENWDEENGKKKLFNWDRLETNFNKVWPRTNLEFDDEAHKIVESTVNIFHKRYLEVLDVWYQQTGNKKLEYVSKNYLVKKYNTGGYIPAHIDINPNDERNTMDWSVLFYLNDDYEGGEIHFKESDILLKPTAGSVLFMPTNLVHSGMSVKSGNKYFLFMVIHTEFGFSSGVDEEYINTVAAQLKYYNKTDHRLWKYTDYLKQ